MTTAPAFPPPDRAATALVALDWGTSSLRAFAMSADGRVLEQRDSAHGILNLPAPGGIAGFERAFAEACGDWLARRPGLPVVAGGMVGSAQGWKEAPYVATPADTATLATRAAAVTTAEGVRILIAPGVLHDPADGVPDVMRGEEIQIAGALVRAPRALRRSRLVLPGTHSKWVEVVDGRIVRFATFMTGELFAILRRHSILGRLMPEAAAPEPDAAAAAFAAGLRAADGRVLAHDLFAVRTLGLMRRLSGDVLEDYLSGLLIGHELAGARALGAAEPDVPVVLIGEGRLSRRYAEALRLTGIPVTAELGNTAPDGLFRFAVAAGLVDEPQGRQQETIDVRPA
ncbi:2-dehydro-3-deoxygalactonokinase [Siculibacillus lacustris]|nr:2-dehydro-3-deoxygalactonokinase [Siculibacillus lacustris]